ncbi:(2Fe-2S)-binding protein [Candidatus Xianfuyuplasma coldseepsis]|uniref:Bacterioferritin-associated ferredoxin n=1 Tax=Candidatus Xianfuyuplasma coldseepsis TaxID=2782163 RepID=A0A7L7KR83_9MOLU|nr:(2Fe-2S)-binding protein [Xianfuyuplasma coldseepsis]QMS84792.1 (2Fe-2S)-binding protein [Xianfuyuplasma coldseepsis]
MDKRQRYIEQKAEQAKIDGVVCVCKQVTERRIRKAVNAGHRRFVSVKRVTEASSSCGLCQPFVEDIIADTIKRRK